MDYKEFIKLINKEREFPTNSGGIWDAGKVILSDTYQGVPWDIRYSLAEEVSKINFGCEFKNNSCIKERENPEPIFFTPAASLHVNYCCSRCFQTVGNLLILPADEKILYEIACLFDPNAEGFWKKDVGCALPAKYRSTMCLVGRCEYVKSKHKLFKSDMLKILSLTNIRRSK